MCCFGYTDRESRSDVAYGFNSGLVRIMGVLAHSDTQLPPDLLARGDRHDELSGRLCCCNIRQSFGTCA